MDTELSAPVQTFPVGFIPERTGIVRARCKRGLKTGKEDDGRAAVLSVPVIVDPHAVPSPGGVGDARAADLLLHQKKRLLSRQIREFIGKSERGGEILKKCVKANDRGAGNRVIFRRKILLAKRRSDPLDPPAPENRCDISSARGADLLHERGERRDPLGGKAGVRLFALQEKTGRVELRPLPPDGGRPVRTIGIRIEHPVLDERLRRLTRKPLARETEEIQKRTPRRSGRSVDLEPPVKRYPETGENRFDHRLVRPDVPEKEKKIVRLSPLFRAIVKDLAGDPLDLLLPPRPSHNDGNKIRFRKVKPLSVEVKRFGQTGERAVERLFHPRFVTVRGGESDPRFERAGEEKSEKRDPGGGEVMKSVDQKQTGRGERDRSSVDRAGGADRHFGTKEETFLLPRSLNDLQHVGKEIETAAPLRQRLYERSHLPGADAALPQPGGPAEKGTPEVRGEDPSGDRFRKAPRETAQKDRFPFRPCDLSGGETEHADRPLLQSVDSPA